MIICLQAGHEGRTSGATGAPGEIELNVRVRNRLSEMLIKRGFVVQLVGADPRDMEIGKDFDLFLALHGDADIYGTGGGCIGSGDKSVDYQYKRSAQIRDAIGSEYFRESGIVEHKERVNKNMTHYYMWSQLTAKTPCVILEMGVVQDAHDRVILADTDRVCKAITRGICKAFGVNYEMSENNPPETSTQGPDCTEKDRVISELNSVIDRLKIENKAKLANKDAQLLKDFESYKLKLTDKILEAIKGV